MSAVVRNINQQSDDVIRNAFMEALEGVEAEQKVAMRAEKKDDNEKMWLPINILAPRSKLNNERLIDIANDLFKEGIIELQTMPFPAKKPSTAIYDEVLCVRRAPV